MLPKCLNRTVVYESDWINLYTDRVQYPDGSILDKHHVLHSNHDSVCVLIQNEKDEIVMIKSKRYVTNREEWEIPAGRVEENETAEIAAKREVMEETGYEINDVKFICSFNPNNGMSDLTLHLFKGQAIKTLCGFDENEVSEVKWFTKDEVRSMLLNNEIHCGVSMIGLLYSFIL